MGNFRQWHSVEKDLDDLQERFKGLRRKLAQQDEALQQGYPPDEGLIEEIRTCKKQFDAIKESLEQLSEQIHLSAAVRQEVHNIPHLLQLWQKIKPLLEPVEAEMGATRALDTPQLDKVYAEVSILPDLIEGLIRENKLEPAFWLSAYYELLSENVPPVPSLWLKMIETSRYVTDLQETAVKDLARFYSQSTPLDEPAFQWLAFAAALLPGYRAPSSGAHQVLEQLDTLPQEIQDLISLFKKGEPDKAHLEPLATEAKHWLEQNRQINPASPLAARLWVSMLEENGLIWKLLSPVCANDISQHDDLSRLVKYLENEACQKKELAMQYRILLKKFRILLKNQGDTELDVFHISGSGTILTRLQEALKLARRWLNSHSDSEGKGQWEAALAKARDRVNALAGEQQESVLLEMAIILARQTLDRFANSVKEQGSKTNATGLGKLAAGSSQLFPEPGGLPSREAIEQVGRAIFNYFITGQKHDGDAGGNNRPRESHGLKKLFEKDDSGIAEYLRDLVSQQEKDFLKDMLKEEG